MIATNSPGSKSDTTVQGDDGGNIEDAQAGLEVDVPEVVEEEEPEWGRVLIAGGTDWATNGRKDRPANAPTDLLEPHTLRSLLNHKMTTLVTGCAANYAIAIDIHGAAHLFGKLPSSYYAPAEVIPETKPLVIRPSSLGLPKGTKWTHGAAGRGHFLLVDSTGGVWGCGNNVTGQLGLNPCSEIDRLTRIPGPWDKATTPQSIYEVSCGHTFSLFLTHSGHVYAAGSGECGQLGNGKTGERLLKGGKTGFDVEVPPRLVQGLSGRKITMIASGNQHSLAMDAEGYVWAWGYAGYSRLGLQDQKDRLVPTLVPSFAGGNPLTRAASVFCGPTNSVVVDAQGIYWMAGKWKITGDGSGGAPWTSFKTIPELMSCRAMCASSGGSSHFLTTPDGQGGMMTVGFGQGALYGELGLGAGQTKSATKPVQIMPLAGVEVLDVAAGPFFTLFLAKPGEKLSEVTRHPEYIQSDDICVVCNIDRGEDDLPMECEKCEQPYHIDCLTPPLSAIPEGEWFCPDCEREGEEGAEAVSDSVPDSNGLADRTPISTGRDSQTSKSRNGHSGTPGAKRGRARVSASVTPGKRSKLF